MASADDDFARVRLAALKGKARHVERLHEISVEIAAAAERYHAAEREEDAAIARYDAGRADLAEVEKFAAKREAAWGPYRELTDEGERLLALGRKS